MLMEQRMRVSRHCAGICPWEFCRRLAAMTAPKAPLVKFDIRISDEMRTRLATQAAKENRSSNAQAVYYIQCGLDGLSGEDLASAVSRIETTLAEIQQAIDRLNQRFE